uniref:Uncharacterized protein n=1 Tax=Anguilla anguilla TaxID=7936 RepID=A0A0E9RL89_ANGAN
MNINIQRLMPSKDYISHGFGIVLIVLISICSAKRWYQAFYISYIQKVATNNFPFLVTPLVIQFSNFLSLKKFIFCSLPLLFY